MQSVNFGGTERERLEISVSGYERAVTGDYDDDNWLIALISVSVGGFRGKISATFQAEEFVSFRDQLAELHQTMHGTAQFETLEEQLSLVFAGNGLGQIQLEGIALDTAGVGKKLEFSLMLDQTHLGASLSELTKLTGVFPVRT